MHVQRTHKERYYLASLLLAFLSVCSSYFSEAIFLAEIPVSKSYLGFTTVAQFSLLFIAMMLAWWYGPKTQLLKDYRALLALAVLLRLVLMPVDAYTSNDVNRYLFDGYIALSRMDPYRVSHDAAALAAAREAWSPPTEHLSYVTLYPPVALGLFSVAASAGAEYAIWLWKLMVTLASLATLLFAVLILNHAQKLQHLPLIALSPILLFESGIGAHVDTFSALAVCAGFYALQRKSLFSAGVLIALGTLIKLLPLVLAAPIVLSLHQWRKVVRFLSALLFTLLSGYAIALALDLRPIGSLGVFFEKFRFGSPYFSLFEALLPLQWLMILSICLAIVGYLSIAYFTWTRSQSPVDKNALVAMQASLCLPLLLSPVVYPWYLASLIPLLAISPNILILTWTALIPLTYEVIGSFICCNDWNPQNWPLFVMAFGLLFSLLIMRVIRLDSNVKNFILRKQDWFNKLPLNRKAR